MYTLCCFVTKNKIMDSDGGASIKVHSYGKGKPTEFFQKNAFTVKKECLRRSGIM